MSLRGRSCSLPEAIPYEDDVSNTVTGIASSGYASSSFAFQLTPLSASPPRNDGVVDLFPNTLQELQLLQRLIALTAFVAIVGIDFDILFTGPMIVRGVDCRGRADLIH